MRYLNRPQVTFTSRYKLGRHKDGFIPTFSEIRHPLDKETPTMPTLSGGNNENCI